VKQQMEGQSSIQLEVERLVRIHGRNRSALMPILQELNRAHSYLSETAMLIVSKELSVPRTEVYGVATFYSFLSVKPRGRYVIRMCRSIACAKQGKFHPVTAALFEELGIKFGETTSDGLFTLEKTNCIGMCDQGPAMLVGDDVHVALTVAKVLEIIDDYRRAAKTNGTLRKSA
jgi:NADH:ubiquinone oxidoreductase subunit E